MRAVPTLVPEEGVVVPDFPQDQGNPARVFIWSQSAGNGPVATYIGHKELYGPKGSGLKGVVFMSSPGFSILPATPPAVQGGIGACADPNGATAGAAPGAGRGPGGPGGGRGKAAPVDEATLLARSNLPGLISSKLPIFVSSAELDPPSVIAFAETLKAELCKAGRCPTYEGIRDNDRFYRVAKE